MGLGVSVWTGSVLARLRVPGARSRHARVWERVACRLDRLGGAYLKAGQVLSTRVDLLSEAQRAPLRRLCDQVTPAAYERLPEILSQPGILDLEEQPFASGSVTNVHRARRRDTGELVAVKVLRPDARARFAADLALMRGFTRMGAWIPLFRSVPMVGAIELLADAVAGHLDLCAEAERQDRLASQLARDDVLVPRPHLELCTSGAIVMDYVDGAVRIDDPGLDDSLAQRAALGALHALYEMLFRGGDVHCDLHPGNMLVTADGTLVLLDFGYASRLDDEQQTAFAELFRAMALADPVVVATVIVDTATKLPPQLDRAAVVDDFRALVEDVAGNTAEEFNVTRFVASLFAIQNKHRIVASPGFTMGIVSLIAIEGLLKQLTPDLDFQREALPYVRERLVLARRARLVTSGV